MGIGKQLKDILDAKNLNPNEFANMLNVRAQRIYNIINRDSKKVDSELLEKMASALGVPTEYFFVDKSLQTYMKTKYPSNVISDYFDDNEDVAEMHPIYRTFPNEMDDPAEYLKKVNQLGVNKLNQSIINRQGLEDQRLSILVYYFLRLNDIGKKELLKRSAEMLQIQSYTMQINGKQTTELD